MKGAIFFASKYGSTAEYAEWIGDATGLPVFDVYSARVDPSKFDFLVLGSPVIYYKLFLQNWLKQNLPCVMSRPVILFSVSGAGAGAKLDAWMAGKLPADLVSHVEHFALRGRQVPKDLTWFDRIMLIVGGLKNPDRVAGREELNGFDYMDRSSIQPIVAKVMDLQGKETATADQVASTG